MKYPIVIHKDADSDYGVTVPDLPGCFSAGATLEEAMQSAQEAILTHVEGLLLDKDPIPTPTGVETLMPVWNEPGVLWAVVGVDLSALSERVKRVNITVPEKILRKIDAFALEEGDTRSGLLVAAALQYISQKRKVK